MQTQTISAIIVLYYSSHLLPSLFENIQRKIPQVDEIILVDNSDEDLSEFHQQNVTIVKSETNIGYGAAINLGVKKARNEIIIAMNPDIEITEWEIPPICTGENLFILGGKPNSWNRIQKFPSLFYDVARLSLKNIGTSFQWVKHFTGYYELQGKENLQEVDWISGSLIFTNRKTFELLEGFDKNFFLFYEEIDLCMRASQLGIPRYIFHSIKFHFLPRTASHIDTRDIKIKSELESFKRYHSKHSGKNKTNTALLCFKIYCFIFSYFLRSATFIFPRNIKLYNKWKQYSLYSKA